MISALLVTADDSPPVQLADDLDAVGVRASGPVACRNLVREAVRSAPDVVICWVDSPDASLFKAFATLRDAVDVPAVVFTNDPDAAHIEQALLSGIHAYEIHGYGRHRLRAVIQLAQARAAHERQERERVQELQARLDERKVVERAKGVLMRSGSLSEEEAFRALREAAQREGRRVGQLSRQIVGAARDAEAVNRAGQLRMLSQRIVKLEVLRAMAVDPASAAMLTRATGERIESNLVQLRRSLSAPTYGDLIDTTSRAWLALKDQLGKPAGSIGVDQIDALDRQAEQLMARAEQLTQVLESSSMGAPLHVINVSGRQRMLSQRLAKQTLLAHAFAGAGAADAAADAARAASLLTIREFEQAMAYLRTAPLSTESISRLIAQAGVAWEALRAACASLDDGDARQRLAASSEHLLDLFEALTGEYEQGMQALMG